MYPLIFWAASRRAAFRCSTGPHRRMMAAVRWTLLLAGVHTWPGWAIVAGAAGGSCERGSVPPFPTEEREDQDEDRREHRGGSDRSYPQGQLALSGRPGGLAGVPALDRSPRRGESVYPSV